MGINSPKEIAQNYVTIGKTKANLAIDKMFCLQLSQVHLLHLAV